jgi:hypothetical protein
VQAAWQGGLLCLDAAALEGPGVPETSHKLIGSLLGLSQHGLSLAVPKPPVVAPVPGVDPCLTALLRRRGRRDRGATGLATHEPRWFPLRSGRRSSVARPSPAPS